MTDDSCHLSSLSSLGVSRRLEFILNAYEYYLQTAAQYPRFKREVFFLLVPCLGTPTFLT